MAREQKLKCTQTGNKGRTLWSLVTPDVTSCVWPMSRNCVFFGNPFFGWTDRRLMTNMWMRHLSVSQFVADEQLMVTRLLVCVYIMYLQCFHAVLQLLHTPTLDSCESLLLFSLQFVLLAAKKSNFFVSVC